MNISQIRYFVAVFDAGSFSKAAKNQFITVQAVSKSVSDLEDELGAPLFERKSRGVAPTAFGKAFYQKAAEVLKGFDDLLAVGGEQAQPAEGAVLRLGLCAPNFQNNEQVTARIEQFLQVHLGFPVQLGITTGHEGIDLLRKEKVDALVTIGPLETPHTDCVPVMTVAPGVSFSANHPLAGKKSVTIAELAPYPVCVSQEFDYFNNSILVTYAKRGLLSERQPILRMEEFRPFLEERHGYAFAVALPALADDRFNTVVRPIAAEDAVEIPICLVSLKIVKSPLYTIAERYLTGGSLDKR